MEPVPSDRKNGLLAPVWTSYQSVLSRAGYEVSLRSPLGKGPGTLCALEAQEK